MASQTCRACLPSFPGRSDSAIRGAIFSAPRRPQDASKTLSRGCSSHHAASYDQDDPRESMLDRFGLPNRPLDITKIAILAETSYDFLNSGKFLNFLFKIPPGLRLDASWASFGRLWASKKPLKTSIRAPIDLQDRPDMRPRALHKSLEAHPRPNKPL